MRPASIPIALAVLAGTLTAAANAATVEVRYDAAKAHSDAGDTAAQREHRLAALADHLRALGARQLPADRTLDIELIDLDLTGTVRILRRPLGEVRVVNGRADGPRIELSYTLRDAGGVLATGRETLHDVTLSRLGDLRDANAGDPLRQEKALLDHWFESRFGSGH